MYEHGVGVEKSDALAAEWYRKAADQGHKDARASLRSVLKRIRKEEDRQRREQEEKERKQEREREIEKEAEKRQAAREEAKESSQQQPQQQQPQPQQRQQLEAPCSYATMVNQSRGRSVLSKMREDERRDAPVHDEDHDIHACGFGHHWLVTRKKKQALQKARRARERARSLSRAEGGGGERCLQ